MRDATYDKQQRVALSSTLGDAAVALDSAALLQ